MPAYAAALFAPVLDRLQGDAAAHFDRGPVRLVPSGYEERPFSHLLRVAVYGKESPTPLSCLFVKIFKPKIVDGRADGLRDRIARDFEATRRAYQHMLPRSDLGAVPPIACYPDLLAIATEQVEGPTLLDYLLTHASWWPGADVMKRLCGVLERVGRWVAVYQDAGQASGSVSPAAIREYIDHRLTRLVRETNGRYAEDLRARLLRHVDDLSSQVPSAEWTDVATHSDLALGNILISGSRVVVLDFAMAKRGTRLHDLTRVFVQLDMLCLKPHLRTRVVKQLQSALVRGFDPAVAASAPLFRLLVLLHRINHLTGVALGRTALPESLYNRLVCRRHERWIAEELERPPAAVELV